MQSLIPPFYTCPLHTWKQSAGFFTSHSGFVHCPVPIPELFRRGVAHFATPIVQQVRTLELARPKHVCNEATTPDLHRAVCMGKS